MKSEKRITLHTCCAPCATACIERLLQEDWTPRLFFSNSNIDSITEYEKRLAEVRRLADRYSLELTADPYDHESWLKAVEGLESEPEEGGTLPGLFSILPGKDSRANRRRTFCDNTHGQPAQTFAGHFQRGQPLSRLPAHGLQKKERLPEKPGNFKRNQPLQTELLRMRIQQTVKPITTRTTSGKKACCRITGR